ncbi:MAG: ABC transporter permease, partial [Tepidiformaceae bacterium]
MVEPSTGNIYDLGYRRYEGARLGRRNAITALYWHSLRTAFGLGRRPSSKVFPFALAALAFVPAAAQLAVAALASDIIELISHEGYYGYTQVILALFVAAIAPELGGKDQRTRTLSLYFSRALTRLDYAAGKFAALVTAMLMLTLLPQAVLFVGNGLAGNDLPGYLRDEGDLVAPIVASALLVSAVFAAIGLAVASQSHRRVYSTVAILALFAITFVVGGIMAFEADIGEALLVSPQHVIRGATLWLFDTPAERDSDFDRAGLDGWVYVVVAVAITAAGAWLFARRMQTVQA